MNEYNFEKNTCDICGITKEENLKKYIPDGYITATRDIRMEASFHLGHSGEVWCPSCFREKELQEIFDLMDKRENENKSKLCNQ